MPREHPTPPPFEPEALERSLNRYLTAGLVFMLVLIAGFVAYKVREPSLRADAKSDQQKAYVAIGTKLYADNCASCHGQGGDGGSGPVLNAKEFLKSTTDGQIASIVKVGVPGSDMDAKGLDYGGPFTDEQIAQVTAYLRSLEANAPSVPDWRRGKSG
jgi:ubiquinol-cytochrome c reductase cytochrome c subunit